MSSRERVQAAIHHQAPDRVPFDLGSTDVSSIHVRAYHALCDALDLVEDIRIQDPLQNLASISAEMRARLQVDTAGVWLNPTLQRIDETHVKDEWGTLWRLPDHGLWYEPVGFPLESASPAQASSYVYPSPEDPSKLSGVSERAKRLYAEADSALVASFSGALLARGQLLRGPAQFLYDLLAEPDLAGEILDRVLDYNVALVDRFLEAVGSVIEVIKVSDDLGAQNSLLLSPALYRRMIKPRQARFFSAIRKKTSARILYHTCGAIAGLIDDFIEIGVDILNPVQVSAQGMDARSLGRQYGGRIAFWGALDIQGVIAKGTPEATAAELRRRIDDLGTAGGYVMAGSHNIPPETPVENILALCRASRQGKD